MRRNSVLRRLAFVSILSWFPAAMAAWWIGGEAKFYSLSAIAISGFIFTVCVLLIRPDELRVVDCDISGSGKCENSNQ